MKFQVSCFKKGSIERSSGTHALRTEFNHAMEDLIGHAPETRGLPVGISTKPSLLKTCIRDFNDIVTLLFGLDQAFGFVK